MYPSGPWAMSRKRTFSSRSIRSPWVMKSPLTTIRAIFFDAGKVQKDLLRASRLAPISAPN